jgi:hypothetical protein
MTGIETWLNRSAGAGSNRSFSTDFNSELLKRSQTGTLPSHCFSDSGLPRGFRAARKKLSLARCLYRARIGPAA